VVETLARCRPSILQEVLADKHTPPLVFACCHCHLDDHGTDAETIVHQLLDLDTLATLRLAPNTQQNALHLILARGVWRTATFRIASLILDRNPDLASALDAGGNSPLALLVSAMLHRAPTGDCPELIALADRLAAAQPATITQRDKAACTPFLDLVRCQSVTATAVLHRFMVHDPVAVSATGCVDGIECLPLHAALRRRTLRTAPCLETVEVLLRAYPEAVVKTSAGSTPLEIALQQNWELPVMENLCTMLLDTWFRVDTTDLHCVIQPHPLAAFCGNRTIVENMTVLNTFCDHFPSLRDGAADHRDAIRRKAATTGASPAAINELDELIMSDKGVLVKAAR